MFKSLCLVLLSLVLAASVSATSIPLTAKIDNLQPVPPTTEIAFGTGVFTLDDVLHILDFSIVTTNVLLATPETTAQLHGPAAVGVQGPSVADIALGSVKLGSLDLTLLAGCAVVTDCEADIKAGLWSVQVNTEGNPDPGGALRGQILPVTVPEPMVATLGLVGLAGLALAGRRRA